jgi:hypothetical protein
MPQQPAKKAVLKAKAPGAVSSKGPKPGSPAGPKAKASGGPSGFPGAAKASGSGEPRLPVLASAGVLPKASASGVVAPADAGRPASRAPVPDHRDGGQGSALQRSTPPKPGEASSPAGRLPVQPCPYQDNRFTMGLIPPGIQTTSTNPFPHDTREVGRVLVAGSLLRGHCRRRPSGFLCRVVHDEFRCGGYAEATAPGVSKGLRFVGHPGRLPGRRRPLPRR